MSTLTLRLFGSPQFVLDRSLCDLKLRKAVALMALLAANHTVMMRESIVAMLWPEAEPGQGRGQLRYALWSIRQELGAEWVQADTESVGLNPQASLLVDVHQFEELIGQPAFPLQESEASLSADLARLKRAVAIYRDDFLAGFTLRGCPGFDEWQTMHTESYRYAFAATLEALVNGLAESDAGQQAVAYAQRWVALDPLHEPAQRRLMQIYARLGQRSAALHQYDLCTQALRQELDTAPEDATTQLRQEILARHFPAADIPAQPLLAEMRPVTVLCVGAADAGDGLASPLHQTADHTPLWESFDNLLLPFGATVSQRSAESMLAVFGAAHVHEDDAERALRAALAMREAARSRGAGISLGINAGTAYVTHQPDTGDLSLVLGGVATLAARLQAQAHRGEIFVSASVCRQTRLAFAYTPAPLPRLGGAESGDAFLLRQPLPRQRKARGLTGMAAPMVGRDKELATLIHLVEQTARGQGRLVFISGEAGIGKSRLVEELRTVVVQRFPGMGWLEGRCQEMGVSTHFWPIRSMLQSIFDLAGETGQAGAVLSRSQAFVDEGVWSQTQRAEALPVLSRLLGIRLGEPWDSRFDAAEPEEIHIRLLQGARNILASIVRQRPTVLVFEDIHWADNPSLDLLIGLMDDLPSLPLLLIGVYRPDRQHRVWQMPLAAAQHCPGSFEEMPLQRLAPGQMRELLCALLATDHLPGGLEAQMQGQALGNPLWLEEVVRSLLDRGVLVRDEDVWHLVEDATPVAVSDDVQTIILARADGLAGGCRAALQRAAVLGQRFPLSLLAGLHEHLPWNESLLHPLMEQTFLYQEASYPEPTYAFTHALVQQALYNSLAQPERRRLHGQAALLLQQRWQEPNPDQITELAHHWAESEKPGQAIPYLLQAGDLARLAYATQEAVTCYRRALAIHKNLGDEKGAAQVWMALGLTYLNARQYTEAQAAYNTGYDLWSAAHRHAPPVLAAARRGLRELCGIPSVTLDPARQGARQEAPGYCLYSGLFEETPALLPVPDLVQSWGVSADGCVYTFRLHDDRRWSDGAPVTAHDIVFTWQRLLDPTAQFYRAPLLYDIVGAEAYRAGSLADPGRIGAKVLDEKTLAVTLHEPSSYFLQLLTHSATFPLPRHVLAATGCADWQPSDSVTSGPFRLVGWNFKTRLWERDQYELIVERNRAYPGRFPGNLQRAEIGPLDWSVAAHLLDTKELDVLALVLMPDEESRRLLQAQSWQFLPSRHWDVVYLGFDTTQPPFDDVRVRQAFAMVMDREAMAHFFVPGAPATTGGFVPRGMPGHSPGIGLPYDPEGARRLLAQAGYARGVGFPSIEYVTPPQAGRLKDAVMAACHDHLGIDLRWSPLKGGAPPQPNRLFMWSHSAEYADPDCFLRLGFPWQDTGWRDSRYLALLAEVRRTHNQTRRLVLYQAADRLLTEEAVLVPLYMGTSPILVKPWVVHYPTSGTRWAYYRDVVLDAP